MKLVSSILSSVFSCETLFSLFLVLFLVVKLITKLPSLINNTKQKLQMEIKEHPFFSSIDWELLEKKQITPPYDPNVKDNLDLKHFSTEFTTQNVPGESLSFLPSFLPF